MKINSGVALLFTAALAAVFLSRDATARNMDSPYAGTIEEGAFTFSVDTSNAAYPGLIDQGGYAVPVDTSNIISEWDNNSVIISGMNATPTQPSFISDTGITLLKSREGFSPIPYVDAKGHSIGYGHFILPVEIGVLTNVTEDEATTLLMTDLLWAVNAVLAAIDVVITQNQFDALVSFCYNVGKNAFAKSTLVKRINAYDVNAVNEFGRWVYSSGGVNASLMARRESEASQFVG